MDTFSTENWQISLPADWAAKDDGEPGQYEFESGDGAKGITIATWRVAGGPGRASREMVETFRATTVASLHAMAGYHWTILVDEIVELGNVAIALSDAFAPAQSYRITGVVLARPPLVVRAAFHDYLCEDIDRSRAYFAPIMESLQLAGQAE